MKLISNYKMEKKKKNFQIILAKKKKKKKKKKTDKYPIIVGELFSPQQIRKETFFS
jgi:triosephosphate isomerase